MVASLTGPGVARPHAPLQVDGGAVGYSATGNLTAIGTRTYEYDAFERMTAAREGGALVAEFVYDATGALAKITDRSGPRPEVRHLLADFESASAARRSAPADRT